MLLKELFNLCEAPIELDYTAPEKFLKISTKIHCIIFSIGKIREAIFRDARNERIERAKKNGPL